MKQCVHCCFQEKELLKDTYSSQVPLTINQFEQLMGGAMKMEPVSPQSDNINNQTHNSVIVADSVQDLQLLGKLKGLADSIQQTEPRANKLKMVTDDDPISQPNHPKPQLINDNHWTMDHEIMDLTQPEAVNNLLKQIRTPTYGINKTHQSQSQYNQLDDLMSIIESDQDAVLIRVRSITPKMHWRLGGGFNIR